MHFLTLGVCSRRFYGWVPRLFLARALHIFEENLWHRSLLDSCIVLCIFHVLIPFFFTSTPTGVETPDVIDLRKQQRKDTERPLYQVSICDSRFWFLYILVFNAPMDDIIWTLSHFCVLWRYLKKKKRKLPLVLCLEQHTRMQSSCFILFSFWLYFFINLIDFMSLNLFWSTFVPPDMWLTLAPKTRQLPKG